MNYLFWIHPTYMKQSYTESEHWSILDHSIDDPDWQLFQTGLSPSYLRKSGIKPETFTCKTSFNHWATAPFLLFHMFNDVDWCPSPAVRNWLSLLFSSAYFSSKLKISLRTGLNLVTTMWRMHYVTLWSNAVILYVTLSHSCEVPSPWQCKPLRFVVVAKKWSSYST